MLNCPGSLIMPFSIAPAMGGAGKCPGAGPPPAAPLERKKNVAFPAASAPGGGGGGKGGKVIVCAVLSVKFSVKDVCATAS